MVDVAGNGIRTGCDPVISLRDPVGSNPIIHPLT